LAKKKQLRADFRKNRTPRARSGDLTRALHREPVEVGDLPTGERISGKGELTRRRTITADVAEHGDQMLLDVDRAACRLGRVLSVHGPSSCVEADDGRQFQCSTRGLLKTLASDARCVVIAGDRVWFRPGADDEGMIERVEPRHGVLARASRGRQHVLVANVDQLLIIASAEEPPLKPNLIDRFLVSAEHNGIRPLICINKIDLVDLAVLQPLVGVYSQMGYRVLLVSARTGFGVERLRRAMSGRQNAVAGQSGVGKSSLLNALEPGLALRVAEVSRETRKGKHTTTTARLLRLSCGGYVVDTPGIRQFELWDVVPAEIAGLFRDLRPYVSRCRYANCTHTHEVECAVKDAVADGWMDARRYESYCHLTEVEA
jgi:ribosome biogenesis GTPase / thiamine phosphate phosphatase